MVPRQCVQGLGTELAWFRARREDDAGGNGVRVRIEWEAASAGGADGFRLTTAAAGAEGAPRELPIASPQPGRYLAYDTSPLVAPPAAAGTSGAAPSAAMVVYRLYGRGGDGGWLPLAEETVALAGPGAGEQPPVRCRLEPPRPNPFNGRVTLPFVLARAGSARLTVHDAAGRLVAVLFDGPCPAGQGRAFWDARDTAGRPVTAGLYFARLAAGNEIVVTRCLFVP